MNELKSTYYGPTLDTPPRATSGRSLSPDALHELRKMRKSMRRLEKLMKMLCLLQLENQRIYQMEADYGNLFALDLNHQRQRHRKPRISLLDILN